jgi:hypothetical protein
VRGLNKAESAALRHIARSHGYTVSRGPTAKDGAEAGNPILLLLAIISGEVATVLMDDEDRRWHAIRLLEAHDDESLRDIGGQLRLSAEREQRNEAAIAAAFDDLPRE